MFAAPKSVVVVLVDFGVGPNHIGKGPRFATLRQGLLSHILILSFEIRLPRPDSLTTAAMSTFEPVIVRTPSLHEHDYPQHGSRCRCGAARSQISRAFTQWQSTIS